MPSIGDLANDVARTLYELRIPVTLGSLAGFVLLVWLARRLGWFSAARRHPRRAASALGVILAVAVPVGWYLGSPIFIRTSLVEAEPAGLAPSAPLPTAGVANESPDVAATIVPTSPDPIVPAATPSPRSFVPTTVATGRFRGTDEFHFGRGTASIIEVEPGRYHLRLDDFSVRNGPDLYVLLSPSADGYDDDAIELGRLKATDGSFGYDLPPGSDPQTFRSALIWCKQFSHLFALAPLGG